MQPTCGRDNRKTLSFVFFCLSLPGDCIASSLPSTPFVTCNPPSSCPPAVVMMQMLRRAHTAGESRSSHCCNNATLQQSRMQLLNVCSVLFALCLCLCSAGVAAIAGELHKCSAAECRQPLHAFRSLRSHVDSLLLFVVVLHACSILQTRALSSAASNLGSSSLPVPRAASGRTAHGTDNPLSHPAGGLGVSALARPAGRQSVSGIVATVFGCSGLLGRYVVNHLGRIGSQVVCPYRSIDGMNVRHLKLAGDLGQIVPIPFDVADMDSVRRAVARSNVVINLIGQRTETVHHSYDDANAKVSYRLAQVSKAMGVEHFIQVSAVGADPLSDSAYFRSKAEGEAAVKEFFPDATIIRPTVMFAPQDHFLSYYAAMGKWLAALPITRDGERRLQPVHAADVARAVLGAIADPSSRGQIYELGGPDVFMEREIIDLCAHHTGNKIRTLNLPDGAARLYGALIGGRRNFSFLKSSGLPGGATIGALASKLSLPVVFHPDLVAQRHVDLVSNSRFSGLSALGVHAPTPLRNEIEKILEIHRENAIDHFPEAEKMKRDARDNASF